MLVNAPAFFCLIRKKAIYGQGDYDCTKICMDIENNS